MTIIGTYAVGSRPTIYTAAGFRPRIGWIGGVSPRARARGIRFTGAAGVAAGTDIYVKGTGEHEGEKVLASEYNKAQSRLKVGIADVGTPSYKADVEIARKVKPGDFIKVEKIELVQAPKKEDVRGTGVAGAQLKESYESAQREHADLSKYEGQYIHKSSPQAVAYAREAKEYNFAVGTYGSSVGLVHTVLQAKEKRAEPIGLPKFELLPTTPTTKGVVLKEGVEVKPDRFAERFKIEEKVSATYMPEKVAEYKPPMTIYRADELPFSPFIMRKEFEPTEVFTRIQYGLGELAEQFKTEGLFGKERISPITAERFRATGVAPSYDPKKEAQKVLATGAWLGIGAGVGFYETFVLPMVQPIETVKGAYQLIGNIFTDPLATGKELGKHQIEKMTQYGPGYLGGQIAAFKAQQYTLEKGIGTAQRVTAATRMTLSPAYPIKGFQTYVKGRIKTLGMQAKEMLVPYKEFKLQPSIEKVVRERGIALKGSRAYEALRKPLERYVGTKAQPDIDIIARGVRQQYQETIAGIKADILPEESLAKIRTIEVKGIKFQSPSHYLQRKLEMLTTEPSEAGRYIGPKISDAPLTFKQWEKTFLGSPELQKSFFLRKDYLDVAQELQKTASETGLIKQSFKLAYDIDLVTKPAGKVLLFTLKEGMQAPGQFYAEFMKITGTGIKSFEKVAPKVTTITKAYPSYKVTKVPISYAYPTIKKYTPIVTPKYPYATPTKITYDMPTMKYEQPVSVKYPLVPATPYIPIQPTKYVPVPTTTYVPITTPKYPVTPTTYIPTPTPKYPPIAPPKAPPYTPPPKVTGLIPIIPKITLITPSKVKKGLLYCIKEKPKKKKARQGYTVEAKEKGKWIQIGDDLPKNRAYKLGMMAADETPVRSFRVRPRGVAELKDIKQPNIFKKFRRSKTPKKKIWVEKIKYAIDTPGELKGITMKGWKAKRLKKLKRFGLT